MALSVKAYLLILSEEQEIRRFSIDDGASSNYDYLVTKIRSVFPRIQNKPLRLFWKDGDGELITFSSHEELVEALGSIQGDVFRVYIKILDGQEDSEKETQDGSSESPAEHVGVVCDGCDHGIVGTRFKCVVCPDYDLCMKCEAKGLHKNHEMFRICTPRVNPWFAGPFPFPGPPPHPGFRPHHPPGFGPWGRGRGRGGRGGHWFGRGRCGGPKGRCDKSAKDKCGQHTEATSDNQDVPVGPPFLHAMGEAIASFLGPMGIEVHTYADQEPDCCQGKCNCDHSEQKANEAGETSANGTESPEKMDSDSQSTSSNPPQSEAAPPADYVMIDKEKQKEAATEKTDGTDETSADSTPQDPLEVAIAQMQAMGFEDHDGWLSRLIVAKEYDIGKVLDAIQYSGN